MNKKLVFIWIIFITATLAINTISTADNSTDNVKFETKSDFKLIHTAMYWIYIVTIENIDFKIPKYINKSYIIYDKDSYFQTLPNGVSNPNIDIQKEYPSLLDWYYSRDSPE